MPDAQASVRISIAICLANLDRTQPIEIIAKPQCMKNTCRRGSITSVCYQFYFMITPCTCASNCRQRQ